MVHVECNRPVDLSIGTCSNTPTYTIHITLLGQGSPGHRREHVYEYLCHNQAGLLVPAEHCRPVDFMIRMGSNTSNYIIYIIPLGQVGPLHKGEQLYEYLSQNRAGLLGYVEYSRLVDFMIVTGLDTPNYIIHITLSGQGGLLNTWQQTYQYLCQNWARLLVHIQCTTLVNFLTRTAQALYLPHYKGQGAMLHMGASIP